MVASTRLSCVPVSSHVNPLPNNSQFNSPFSKYILFTILGLAVGIVVNLICNNFKKDKDNNLEDLNIYHEVYLREENKVDISDEIDKFVSWLKTNNLYQIFQDKWESIY